MTQITAFIDESGNPHLSTEKAGTSKYFVLTAILVHADKANDVLQQVTAIKTEFFSSGEMKSNKISGIDNHKRRIAILDRILQLDFKLYYLAVEKELVFKDSGLKFKKSFLKFINGKVYSRLFTTFPEIQITGDEHGSGEFMASMEAYLAANHKPDLFYKSGLCFVKSHEQPLVQLADVVGGTIAQVYEEKHNDALYEKFRELLNLKALALDEWPTRVQTYFPPDRTTDTFNAFVYKTAVAKAELFIEKHEEAHEEEIRIQVCVARKLVFHALWGKDEYLSAPVILVYLRTCNFNISEQFFRTAIIAKLRDSDVIISSCNKGYKIPSSYADILDFIERVDSLVVPYLRRLKRARDIIHESSLGEYDLLKGTKYPALVKLLETFDAG